MNSALFNRKFWKMAVVGGGRASQHLACSGNTMPQGSYCSQGQPSCHRPWGCIDNARVACQGFRKWRYCQYPCSYACQSDCVSFNWTMVHWYGYSFQKYKIQKKKKKNQKWGFPSGSAVKKNPPANAGDRGSIPGLRRFHVPWGN